MLKERGNFYEKIQMDRSFDCRNDALHTIHCVG